MNDRVLFLLQYLAFFLLWVMIAFTVNRGLRWFTRCCLKESPVNKDRIVSWKAKLKGYLLFQFVLVTSVILGGFCYISLIVVVFGVAFCELFYCISKSHFRFLQKTFWIMSGLCVLSVAALSFACLSLFFDYRLMIMLLFVLSASDAFSQVVGECLRGPLILPNVSPNKTWTGFAGGFAFSLLASISFYTLFRPVSLSVPESLFSAAVVFLCAFAGDASVSFLKRRIGIKDFSHIMGPQGGMLDRLDSMIVLGPVASMLLVCVRSGM